MYPLDVPVLIVGAGPTGMVMANELARRQIPCRLIDRKTQPTRTSRSFTLHARTMEMFEHMGLAHRFLEHGIKSRGFTFRFEGKDERPKLDFTGLATRYPHIVIYNQNETEQRLREHLEATYSIRPEWGVALAGLSQRGDRFTASLVHERDGRRETVTPEWIIGCDGVHSFVRRSAGLEFEGEAYEGMVMQMMDVRCHGYSGPDDWINYYIAKDHLLLISKLPGENHRVLISEMGEADAAGDTPQAAFQRRIATHLHGMALDEPEWITKWTIWKRLATAYRKGNAFLVGDAAHVHSPSGGQGMNVGMQDAFNLGWKLAMVMRGEGRAELLDTYERERQPIGAQAIAGTEAMHEIIMAHGRNLEDRLELTRQPSWHAEAVNRISGLSYNYRESIDSPALAGAAEGPMPGDRAPDVRLSSRLRLFDLLRHPGLTVLALPAPDDSEDLDRALALVAGLDDRFAAVAKGYVVTDAIVSDSTRRIFVRDETGEFARLYGPGRQSIYAVRPDGYVAFHGHLAEAEPLFRYLDTWFVPRR